MIVLKLRSIFLINFFPILLCLKTVKLVIIILVVIFVLRRLMSIIDVWCPCQSNGPGPSLKVVALLLLQLQRFGDFLVFLYLKYPLEFLRGVRKGLLIVVGC